MSDPTKLKRLQDLRAIVASGRIPTKDFQRMFVEDTDGRTVRLSADEAMAVLDRRIAAEEAQA